MEGKKFFSKTNTILVVFLLGHFHFFVHFFFTFMENLFMVHPISRNLIMVKMVKIRHCSCAKFSSFCKVIFIFRAFFLHFYGEPFYGSPDTNSRGKLEVSPVILIVQMEWLECWENAMFGTRKRYYLVHTFLWFLTMVDIKNEIKWIFGETQILPKLYRTLSS